MGKTKIVGLSINTILFVIFLFANMAAKVVSRIEDIQDEEYLVNSIVLNDWNKTNSIECYLIRKETINREDFIPWVQYFSLMEDIEESTLNDFIEKNRFSFHFKYKFPLKTKYFLIDDLTYNDTFSKLGTSDKCFKSLFPNFHGLVHLGRVGFNSQRTQALVYFDIISGSRAGAGYYILLKKSDSEWKIKQWAPAWIS